MCFVVLVAGNDCSRILHAKKKVFIFFLIKKIFLYVWDCKFDSFFPSVL